MSVVDRGGFVVAVVAAAVVALASASRVRKLLTDD